MTSSGTTYCSSDTDDSVETAVFVMGNEIDSGAAMLEVRTLGPIDEEKEEPSCKSDDVSREHESVVSRGSSPEGSCNASAAQMPPTIAPISVSAFFDI